jgi:phosphatidylglycerol:prolipoprotein diacylglycerol transferase
LPFPEFDPVLFQIGPFALRWYALAYVAGIALGWFYGVRLIKNPAIWRGTAPPVTQEQVDDLLLWIVVGIIAGGRLGYVLFYRPDLIWRNPLEILQIWNGGMSFHGGALGVAIGVILSARAQKIDLLRLADLVAPCVPFGLLFGRLANFVNGELWGRETDAPWGVIFCNRSIEATYGSCAAGYQPRHPTQLYEALLEGIVLFLILRWATHGARLLPRRGLTAGLFLLCYGIFRIGVEFVREPDFHMPHFPLGLTMGMILSIPMVAAGVFLIARARAEVQGEPEPAEGATGA